MSTLEEQIRAIADEAFAQTEPVDPARQTKPRDASVDLESVDLDTRRRASGPRRLLAVAAGLLLVALVGGLLVTQRNTAPIPADEPNGLSVVGLLGNLPIEIESQVEAVDGNLSIGGVDLVALERLAGIERPVSVTDPGPWIKLGLGSGDLPIPRSELFRTGLTNAEAFTDELPFSAADVDRYVTVDVSGGGLIDGFDVFTLLDGSEAVAAAVGEDNLLKVGEGEPGARSITDRTPLRPIGQPLFVGFDPDRDDVAVGAGADLMSAWLDNDGNSLMTSSTGLVAVAEQLDRIDDLVGFQVFARDFSVGALSEADAEVLDDFATIDRPFSRVGIGWSGIADARRLVYVFDFGNDDDASGATPSVEAAFDAENALPTPPDESALVMGQLLDVESIETVGRTVVVTTRPTDMVDGAAFFVPPAVFLYR